MMDGLEGGTAGETAQQDALLARLTRQDAVLVTVVRVRGSAPRETGAWMAVFVDDALGSVGGGHLEWQALAEARRRLAGASGADELRYALGASLGQCCGGEVWLHFARVGAAEVQALRAGFSAQRQRWPAVAIFGAGHVGRALLRVLLPLPLRLHWVDSRDHMFDVDDAEQMVREVSDPPQAAVPGLAPDSQVLVLTHSHAQDLDIVAACLQRQRAHADLARIGLLGSRSKWATFRHRLLERGFTDDELARVQCPIGVPGIDGKSPAVLAVALAAQVLQQAQVDLR